MTLNIAYIVKSKFVKYTVNMEHHHTFRSVAALVLLLFFTISGIAAETPATAEESYIVSFFTRLNKTQKRLDLMNRKGYLSKLGTEEIQGLISGTLSYKTTVKGLSGIVTLTYDNYCDEEGWIFNGEIIVKSNMVANGSFAGKITVTGTHPGTVYYENVTMKSGAAAGGTYGVELPGSNRTEVDYSWYFKAE